MSVMLHGCTGNNGMRSIVTGTARLLAILGGCVLLALILLTCLSVLGRMGNSIGNSDVVTAHLPFLAEALQQLRPVAGDVEIVEAGVAFAILAFFPWCTMQNGHAAVNIFTAALPVAVNRFLTVLWDLLFAVVLGIISWRLYAGTTDKLRYQETTLMLEYPVWWGFAACTASAFIASLVAVYVTFVHGQELLGRGEGLPQDREVPRLEP
jgi:TRAP-type C4-dicarboxylate transport system permease small subunit